MNGDKRERAAVKLGGGCYEVFRRLPDGDRVWVCLVKDRDQAERKMRDLRGILNQEYLAINFETGDAFQAEELSVEPKSAA